MDVHGRSFGASALLLLVAIVIFVLAAFGAHVASLTAADLQSLGLAVGFAAFLVP